MAVKNLVSGVLAQSITTSTTNVLVNIAENTNAQSITDFFPNPPFYITIMPKTPTIGVANRLDSEILQVTAVGNDQSGNASLTCVRGQRDTTAKAFSAGSIVTVGVYAEDAVFLGGEGSAVGTPAPWIESSDIKNGAVTTDKISDGAVTKTKVGWSSFIKIGTVKVEYQANNTSGGFANVTFDTPFTNTPIVFAQDLLANGSVSSVTVSKVTTTGFRVLARTTNNSSAGTATVNWLAFSQQG